MTLTNFPTTCRSEVINMKVTAIHKIAFSLVFLLLSLTWNGQAQEIPDPPVPPKLVVDYTGTLAPGEMMSLERKLVAFSDTTSNQIAIVMVPDFNGLVKEDFGDRLAEKWGVGKGEKDNGIVVLVKPKSGRDKGEMFISVGYGLEGAIPDAIAKRIVEQEMIPAFRENRYYEGLNRGTDVLMALSAGEYSADEYASGGSGGWGILVPFLALAFVYLLIRQNSRRHYSTGGRGTSVLGALWLASMMSHRGGRGSWSDFNSGSGSFGGGGGFGGFGGGSFGGGGAGGSW